MTEQEIAIEFAEWIAKSKWRYKAEINKWVQSYYLNGYEGRIAFHETTTSKLFAQFLKELKHPQK